MFIIDILIYVIFACVMSTLAKKSCTIYPDRSKWDFYLISFMLFYTLICAIRWNVGVDSVEYAYGFVCGDTRDNINGEFLFSGLQNISAKLHLHFVIGMGVCAFLQIYFISEAVKEYKYILVTLPIALFGSRYFLDLNNGIRQMIVASMFVFASRYIVDKQIFKYILFILIASTIHHSSFMLFPFYFIPKKAGIGNKRIVMSIIFIVCFIAGLTPSFQGVIQYAEMLSDIFGYEGYTERVTTFLSQGQTSEALSFGPMMLSYFLTALAIIWYGPQLKQRYENKIPYFNLWYNLSFFYACAYFLICNISHIFIRPVQYLELFQLIIVSLLLYDLGLSKFKRQLSYILLLIILWVNISWNVTKVSLSDDIWESATYKVFFMHQEQLDTFFN